MMKTTFLYFVFSTLGIYALAQFHDVLKILGGTEVQTIVPYQVSIRDKSNRHFCAGSIVSKRTILTAAHCLNGRNENEVIVVAGSNDLKNDGTIYTISSFKIHESYNPMTFQNDIGLIRLNKDITLNKNAKIIPINTKYIPKFIDVMLTGWGLTSYPGNSSRHLNVAKLKTISNRMCALVFLFKRPTFHSQLCTLSLKRKGPCYGDSGGPLVSKGSIVGIVSGGIPCALGYPDIFTRVSSYTTWLIKNIEDEIEFTTY